MVMTFSRIFDWDDAGWRKLAACRTADPDMFFPTGSTGAAVAEIRAATAVCQSCAVRGQCLQFALRTNQEAGIWGGTCEDERRRLRRASRIGRRPTLVQR